MYTLGKPHLFYYNVDRQELNIDTQRNGQSTKRKWTPLKSFNNSRSFHLIKVSLWICTHPFNPKGVFFNRKPFSTLKENEFGIAIKGTPIRYEDWENLYTEKNPIPLSIRKMMNTKGAEISYPNLVESLKTKGLYELAKKSIGTSGINSIISTRKLPQLAHPPDFKSKYYVPLSVYAIEIQPYSSYLKILFNEKQTVKSWTQHHNSHDLNWETKITNQI